ncbi:hypothetical protein BLOT_012923 [Blomia tropicalis]|nr:hypothetical protein BLOT_012923 [Blomia tropicalis]
MTRVLTSQCNWKEKKNLHHYDEIISILIQDNQCSHMFNVDDDDVDGMANCSFGSALGFGFFDSDTGLIGVRKVQLKPKNKLPKS